MSLKGLILILAMALIPSAQGVEEKPETVAISVSPGVKPAIPRPISSRPAGTTIASPGPMEPEMKAVDPNAPPAPSAPTQAPGPDGFVGPQMQAPPVYNWNEAWHEKPVAVIGIDITNFPEVMAIVSLRKDLYTPITEVRLNELKVSEDEAPQQITSLAPCVPDKLPGEPMTIMFLIDASGSMQEYIDVVQTSVSRFVDRFYDDDQAGVVAFADQAIAVTPLTNNIKKVQKGIFEIKPRGFTALYDSVDMGTRMLAQCPGKKGIILVTDGKDDDGTGAPLSRATLDRVVDQALGWRIPIFIIGIGDEVSLPEMQTLARRTGGEFLFAPTGEDVDALYSVVAQRLGRGDQGYYQITYRTSQYDRDGSTRTIIVKHRDEVGVAQYPAPRHLFWPLSKVFR